MILILIASLLMAAPVASFTVPLSDLQYGHAELYGLAPGKNRLFSWDSVERDEWEDPDFLKESEEKGVTIDVKDSDTKSIELNLIRVKNTAVASE